MFENYIWIDRNFSRNRKEKDLPKIVCRTCGRNRKDFVVTDISPLKGACSVGIYAVVWHVVRKAVCDAKLNGLFVGF